VKEVRVVKGTQLPTRCPFISTITMGLLLDRLKAPGWAWGVIAAVYCSLWINWIIEYFSQSEAEVTFK
jgi:hypothetical protein